MAARTTILAHDEARAYTQGTAPTVRPVHIGQSAFIGVHSVILPGASIGDHAIVGAGSVVTRPVAMNTVVAGVPARVMDDSDRLPGSKR